MHNHQKVELEAKLLAVLAQTTRLKILYCLREGERCGREINPIMAEDASVISRHLVQMRDAGLLEHRREGVAVYYRIREPRIFKILEMVDEILQSTAHEKVRQVTGK